MHYIVALRAVLHPALPICNITRLVTRLWYYPFQRLLMWYNHAV